MKSTTIFSGAVLVASQLFTQAFAFDDLVADKVIHVADHVVRAAPSQTPSQTPFPKEQTSHGCYSSGGNLTKVEVDQLSSGNCRIACAKKSYYVMGLHGTDCLCGFAYPPADDVTKDSNCNYPCPQYPPEACGGLGTPGSYTIFNTGVEIEVPDYVEEDDDDKDSDKKTSSTSAAPSETAAETSSAAATSAAAETSSAAPEDDKSSGGGNSAAIAGGVVAGVVVIAAGIGGLFFWMRRKRNAEIEEEHRRNAAVNAFISGAKPPGSSDGISMTDSRMDPVMAHRRLSDGSIADNEDYSRRILRVTNA